MPNKWCLKVVVQLELDRLDNDKHIAALYFSMVTAITLQLISFLTLGYRSPIFSLYLRIWTQSLRTMTA